MAKNIVLCSDGTGNSAMKGRGTNVFKIYESIDLNGHIFGNTLLPQVAFYDDGVGTENLKFLKILGGAFGWGLSRNVRELYAALARCYEPGDQIFLFGFSRGAFTVRQLAGFIIGCGIINNSQWETDGELNKLIKKAFRIYRQRYRTWLGAKLPIWFGEKLFPSNKEALKEFRETKAFQDETYAPDGKVNIRFIGVWDTVAAVGLPFDQLADFINNVFYRFKFPDRYLSSRVDKACHALAIDDERHSFHPEVWTEEKKKKEDKESQDDRIEQVWFAGVHSNVGGGYPKQGMSLVALDWMMAKAEAQGLRFIKNDRASYCEHNNVNDKLYDSRSGIGTYYRYKVRDISRICSKNNISADIHISAFNRISLGTDGYAPVNLPTQLNIVATSNNPPALQGMKELAAKVNKALSTQRPFLNHAKKWMLIRRYSHYALLGFTIAIVWMAKSTETTTEIESPFLNGFLNVVGFIAGDDIANDYIKPLLASPDISFTLLGLLILFYLVGSIAKSRIKKIFSSFWRRTLS